MHFYKPVILWFLGVSNLVKVYWASIDSKAAFKMPEDDEKVKLRRIEPAIQKFVKVAIPTDLERLRKHQINIEKVSVHFLLIQFFLQYRSSHTGRLCRDFNGKLIIKCFNLILAKNETSVLYSHSECTKAFISGS